jgi:hypothetical protein
MAVRVLLVVAAFAVLYGCGQANSPPEKQEKQAGAERVAREKDENKEATKEKVASGYTKDEHEKANTAKAASASASESASANAQGENSAAEDRQRVMELECTLDRYAQKNNLSVNEQQALTDKALNVKEAHMERYPNDTDYYILDAFYELGVPDYGDYCEVAGE